MTLSSLAGAGHPVPWPRASGAAGSPRYPMHHRSTISRDGGWFMLHEDPCGPGNGMFCISYLAYTPPRPGPGTETRWTV